MCQWENLSRPIPDACVVLLSLIYRATSIQKLEVHHVISLLLERDEVSKVRKKEERRYHTLKEIRHRTGTCPFLEKRNEDEFIKQRKSKKIDKAKKKELFIFPKAR